MFKDLREKPIDIGDTIVCQAWGWKGYLKEARVIGFTDKTVKVLLKGDQSPTWAYAHNCAVVEKSNV